MLEAKLTVPLEMIGNDLHMAEQLIRFIKRSILVMQELKTNHGVHIETYLQ